MKKLGILIITLCSVLALSCQKQTPAPDLFIAAVVGGANWQGEPFTNYLANSDTLQVQGVKGMAAGSNQKLTFKIRFNGVGNYALTGGQAGYAVNIEAGEPTNYKLDPGKVNTVAFAQYDGISHVASGSFQLYFIKDSGNPSADNAVSFTTGRFWIQLP